MSHKSEKDKPKSTSEQPSKPKRTRITKPKPNIPESVVDSGITAPSISIWQRFGRKEVGALIGSGAFSLFPGLVVCALQIAGVISMEIAHLLMIAAWVVAVGGVSASEHFFSTSKIRSIVVVLSTVIIFGIGLFEVDRWMVNKKAELDKQAETKKPISQQTVTDYGSISLKPANEPTPNLPPDCMMEGDTAVFLGNEVVLTRAQSAIIIKVDEESVLSFRKVADGIKFNAVVRSKTNQQAVSIVENVFSVLPNSGYRVLKENESTLAVFTPENEEALYVKLLNPSVILVRGIFFSPKTGRSFNIKDEVKLGRKIRMDCMRSEGNGSLFGL